jgi:hypothetical protein
MIEKYSFGSIVVNGQTYKADLKIIGGNVVTNWWRKEGHRLRIEDINDILEYKPEVLIVGTGFFGMMKIDEALKKFLEENGIKVIAERTGKAVNAFNDAYREIKKVAGAFHLTC